MHPFMPHPLTCTLGAAISALNPGVQGTTLHSIPEALCQALASAVAV